MFTSPVNAWKQWGRSHSEQAQAALVLASCLVVPLLFSLAQRDMFALTKLTALQVIAILGILLLVERWAFGGQRQGISLAPLDIILLALVLLNVVACVFSIDPIQSLTGEDLQYQGLLSVLLYVAFFYLAYTSLTDESRIVLLFGSMAIGATLVAAYAVVQRARLDPIWGYPPDGRPFSTIGQPNALAAYLVVAIPVSASLLPRTHSRTLRAIIILAIGTMVAAIASTKSRGGYAGLVVTAAMLTMPLVPALKPRSRSGLYGFLIGLTGLALVVFLVPLFREATTALMRRALSRGDLGELSVEMHLELWTVAAWIALAHPLFGTGQETFPDVFPRYSEVILGSARASAYTDFRVESPHNVYLAMASGAGFPALGAYVALIAGVVFTVARAIKRSRSAWRRVALAAVLAAVAGHLVTDTFMTAEVTSTWLFWVLMGAGLRMAREDPEPALLVHPGLDGGGRHQPSSAK